MIGRLLSKRVRRMREAALELERAEEDRIEAEARSETVREDAEWAAKQLRVNHLTEMFYREMRGGAR